MAYKVFISYAEQDVELRNNLEVHLAHLKLEKLIATLDKKDIIAREEKNQQLLNLMNTAHIILLLISPDFIASHNIEMAQAIARHESQRSWTIPIILRPSRWERTALAKIQVLPSNKTPVTRWSSQDEAFKHIVEGIEKVLEELEKKASSITDIFYEQRKQYCKKLYDQYKTAELQYIRHTGSNQIAEMFLTQVFVLPHVRFGIPIHETLERNEDQKSSIADKKERNKELDEDEQEILIRKEDSFLEERRTDKQREDFRLVLAKQKRLIVLGDAGSGKSTLLRYLLLILAEDSNRFTVEFPQLASTDIQRTPLYISLASYAEYWLSHKIDERSLKDFLPGYLHSRYLDDYTSFIYHELEHSKLFILFDGLDEILDTWLRIQIVRQIEVFTRSYPQNYFITTSRIVGYKDSVLAAEYQAYTLEDFNDEQIKSLAYKWYLTYERSVNQPKDNLSTESVARTKADKLYQAILNKGIKRLAVNPLLLTILVFSERQGVNLLSHRVELFDHWVDILLQARLDIKEYPKKDLGETKRFSKEDLIKVLRPLSFWMHERPAIGAISKEELLDQISKQLLEQKITRFEDDAYRSAQEFLQMIHGQTGILVEREKQRYGFLHPIFEEYFAACHLALQEEKRDTFIGIHLHDSRWRTVILLAVSYIGIIQREARKFTKIVEEIIRNAGSRFERLLHLDLQFTSLCLADGFGANATYEDTLIQEILSLYVTTPYVGLRQSFLDLLDSWRGTSLANKATKTIVALLPQIESAQFSNFVDSLEGAAPTHTYNVLPPILYYQLQTHQNRESMIRLVKLKILRIANSPGGIVLPTEEILATLTDPNSDVREAAASLLGQLSNVQPEVIPALLRLLIDPDADVRSTVAITLGQLGTGQPDVITALLRLFTDSSWQVRRAAIIALGQLGIGQPVIIQPLLKLLTDFDADVRQTATRALGHLGAGQPKVVQTLIRLLSDTDKNIQQAAVVALGQIGDTRQEVIRALLGLLTSSSLLVQRATVITLGRLGKGQPETLPALQKLLIDSDADIREDVATALGQLGMEQSAIIPTLLLKLIVDDPDVRVQRAAAIALGQLGQRHPELISIVLGLLTDPKPEIQHAAVIASGQLDNTQPEFLHTLLELLSDPDLRRAVISVLGRLSIKQPVVIQKLLELLSDADIREAIVTALGQIGNAQPEVVPELLRLLTDPGRQVQRAAIIALGQIGSKQPEVISALLGLLADSHSPDYDIREAIATTLGQIGSKQPEVISALLKLLADPSWQVQRAAIIALGQIGSKQSEVISALLKLLADPGWQVQRAAIIALGQIGSKQPEVISALLGLLADSHSPDYDIREAIATTLGQIGSKQPEVISALLKLLADPSWQVQRAAIIALGQSDSRQPEIILALLRLLTDSDINVQQIAAVALTQLDPGRLEFMQVLYELLLKGQSPFFLQSHSIFKLDFILKKELISRILLLLGELENNEPEVIQLIQKFLTSNDIDIRRAAIMASGQLREGQPEIILALLELLTDTKIDTDTRQAVITALEQLGNEQPVAVRNLLRLLTDTDKNIRQVAASVVRQLGNLQPTVIQTLLRPTTDADTNIDIRQTAIAMLGALGNKQPEVIPALLELLANHDTDIRRTVVTALGQLGKRQPAVVSALLELLTNPDSHLQRAAVATIGELGEGQPEVILALLKLLTGVHTNADVRRAAITTLGQLGKGQPAVVSALLELLTNPDSYIQRTAITALGRLGEGQPEVVSALLKLLTSLDWQIRRAAITALGRLGEGQPEVVPTLLELLTDANQQVRHAAIAALGQLGNRQPEVIPALLEFIVDSDTDVRRALAITLGQLGSRQPEVIPALLELLVDSDTDVRQAAAITLGQLGSRQPEVISDLLELLVDSDTDVRQAAVAALKSLNVDKLTIGIHLEEILLKLEPITSKQLNATYFVNSLFNLLLKMVEDA